MSPDAARGGHERGSVTLFLTIAVLGLLVLAGLVVDGAAKVRAVQRADRLAAEAARAAGQALDLTAVLQGRAVRVDRRAAVAAARAYLRDTGVAGDVAASPTGDALRVTTTTSEPTVFLGLIGVPSFTVHGHADVSLVHRDPGGHP